MKKSIIPLLVSIFVALPYGCATQDSVRQQIEPMSRRIDKLEAELEQAKKEAAKTTTMAQEATKNAERAEAVAERAETMAQKAAKNAERAEAVAERAEAAAKKMSKAFELQPKQ